LKRLVKLMMMVLPAKKEMGIKMNHNKNAARQSDAHNSSTYGQHTKAVTLPSIPYWGEHAMTCINNGYDVVPLHPQSKIPVGKNWATKEILTVGDINRHSDNCGIGVRTKNMPAIDVDTTDETLGNEFRNAALEVIGAEAKVLIRFGQSPKFLIPCRLATTSFKKLTSKKFVKPEDEQSKPTIHMLEILGDGQQFVAFGVHPDTKSPYSWEQHQDITGSTLDELPELDKSKATQLIAIFERLAVEAGYVVYSKSASSASRRKDSTELSDDSNFLENLGATFPEYDEETQVMHLTSAIEFIKHHKSDPTADYDYWISIGQALASSKGTPLEHRCEALWRSVCYDEDEAHTKWKGFTSNSTSLKAVYAKATRLDWKNPAKGQSIGNYLSQEEKLAASLDRFGYWVEVVNSSSLGDLKAVRELMTSIAQDCELGATERNLLAEPIKNITKEKLGLNQPIADIRKAIKYKDARLAETAVIDLDPDPFSRRPKNTIENFELIMGHFGVEVRYNKMTKRDEIKLPYSDGAPDTEDQAKLARVTSLLEQVSMPTGHTCKYLSAVANANAYNPVENYLLDGTWDGKDRIGQLCDELVTPPNYDINNKRIFITRWLLSCVSAVLSDDGYTDERQFRYVLTLQGGESIGKTTWLLNLVPPATRRKIPGIVKTALSIDPRDPNSVKEAISCWIGEVGELDATLNKADLGKLKGFLSNNVDSPRRLYVNDYSPTPRRTVWCASVNGLHFLDDSDNTRFMVIPLVSIARNRPTDRDQLWFQIVDMYKKGEVGELTKDEQLALIESNKSFRKPSMVREAILDAFDWSAQDTSKWRRRGLREILTVADFNNIESRRFDKEARHILQDLCKESGITRSNGKTVYMTPPLAEFAVFEECELA
jgi:predicted P-loop ATPase